MKYGFTLIEMSIVLVIIGLIIGGVLVGRDLIAASQLRAQVSQFEKYNVAVNTFRGKYNCLPGDCANATEFLSNITMWSGDNGNGNGIIEDNAGGGVSGTYPGAVITEPLEFWIQLYAAGLTECCSNNITTGYNIGLNFPQAKMGVGGISALGINGVNGYFWGINVSNGPGYVFSCGGQQQFLGCLSNPVTGVITTAQAQAFDTKIDDGQATTGRVYCL